MQGLEAAFDRSWSQNGPSPRRTAYALEVLWTEVLKIKETAEQPSRALRNDHRFWLSDALQARCEVRRLSDDAALLRLSRSNQIADHDQAGGNAYAGLQGSAGIQSANRLDQLQPCPYRSLGVVLVGLRITEV